MKKRPILCLIIVLLVAAVVSLFMTIGLKRPPPAMPTVGRSAPLAPDPLFTPPADAAHIIHPRATPVSEGTPLAAYPVATPTIGERLHLKAQAPSDGFTAYYFDRRRPDTIFYQEPLPQIGLDYYRQTDTLGIPFSRLDTYWVGRLHVPTRTAYRLYSFYGTSGHDIRILIDGHLILADHYRDKSNEPDARADATVVLEAGEHLIEAEYHGHPPNVVSNRFITYITPQQHVADADLRAAVDTLQLPADTVVVHAAADTGEHNTRRVDNVQIDRTSVPADKLYILILDSAMPVDWSLNQLHQPPRLIINNLAANGSRFIGAAEVPRLAWQGGIPDKIDNECRRCTALGIQGCERRDDSLLTFAARLEALTGFPPANITPQILATCHKNLADIVRLPDKTLADFPLAARPWGDVLNPGGDAPDQGFTAYYIDSDQPRRVVARETVPAVGIHYENNNPHGIPASRFGAYWVGRLHVPARAAYTVATSYGYSRSRILIDRRVVLEEPHIHFRNSYNSNNSHPSQELTLEAGDHLIEVEYLNADRDMHYQLNIAPTILDTDYDGENTLHNIVSALKLPATTVTYAVGIQGSSRHDNQVTLQAPAGERPYILFLGSKEAVYWRINGRSPVLVVYNNRAYGSSVDTVTAVPRLAWPDRVNADIGTPRPYSCYCHADSATLQCGERPNALARIANFAREELGYPLMGISGGGRVSHLLISQPAADTAALLAPRRPPPDIEEQRQDCADEPLRDIKHVLQQLKQAAPHHATP